MKNMRIMRIHEAFPGYGGINLFCRGLGFTKHFLYRLFWQNCLINPHNPHDLRIVNRTPHENMRIMRIHEAGVFKGFRLPCIGMGIGSRPKHEAVMRIHEADPHVFASGGAL